MFWLLIVILRIFALLCMKRGDYLKQHAKPTAFKVSESWIILDQIEKSIKEKIENLGTPLSEWDLKINYGIKTGFNKAFIISGKKREEILDKDLRSAEIIRPILRGKDIKRYSYEFADKWLICTFPSKKYNIADFPAIRTHLLSFGKERLEQSGEKCIFGIKGYNARKRTNNKWFEIQDSTSYWEEFYKQKIVFPAIMSQGAFFALDNDGYMILAPGNIITGEKLIALVSFLVSPICYFALRNYYMGGGIEGELKVNRLLLLPIPKNIKNRTYQIEEICEIYQLNDKEINFISSSFSSK